MPESTPETQAGASTSRPLKVRLLRASRHISRLAFAVAIASILSQFPFDYIEAFLFDARIRMRPSPDASEHIATIAIDPATVSALGRVPNALDYARLLENLKTSGAKHIVFLVSPAEIVGSYDELSRLSKIAESTPGFVVAVDDVPLKGEKDALKLAPPFEKVATAGAPVPVDRNIFARDDVTRRMMLAYQDLPTMLPLIASDYAPELKARNESEPYNRDALRGDFDYLKSDQAYVQFSPRGTYKPVSFLKALELNPPLNEFAGKTVIVGRDIETTSKDYIRTPYSRDIVAMTNIEYFANALNTLITNSALVRAPKVIGTIVTAAISYMTVIVVLTASPTLGLAILGATIAGLSFVALLLFWLGNIWIALAHPFLAVFICYYFFIPYRLIIENRRSWEYYQKNRLLTQVEELKTNFLSMMSHDLKTPIARIQGMTDIVKNDANPLSPRQREAVDTVRRSSDELLEFVSGILNLGRIESKAIQLHLHSKDVNTLVKDVVQKLDYMARSKQIEIRSELEPLFSIKIDVDLIRQVLQNLIENAIKYSPDGTSILVSTEERDGWIVVQVADQGPGIPESELPHIFMKFYRSRNAKASTIKGSGLGLYLAKYFVELHKGRIHVDSRPGQGSTFTVELPSA